MRYRWGSPQEWLVEAFEDGRIDAKDLLALALTLDGDAIQDVFQTDMDRDGYFHGTDH